MAKYGFLDILAEVLDRGFHYDYEMNWDKRNHTVEVSFLLEVQNSAGIETIDAAGQTAAGDIVFEETILFYNPAKSQFAPDDYLTVLSY